MVGILAFARQRITLLSQPRLRPDAGPSLPADPQQADLFILANGLERLMGRCARRAAERHYPASLRATETLRVQRRKGVALELPAELLSDLSHELAGIASAPVREAAVRLLRRQAVSRAPASS